MEFCYRLAGPIFLKIGTVVEQLNISRPFFVELGIFIQNRDMGVFVKSALRKLRFFVHFASEELKFWSNPIDMHIKL